MEIQQLRGFVAVARHSNFTVAARSMGRSQPTVSLQVKALEDELEVKLFERLGPKKITLTTEGRMLYDLCTPLLENYDSLRLRFDEACGAAQAGQVRIVTHRSVMVFLLPSVLKAFKKKYPDCHLSILNRDRDEIVKLVEEGEADVGITSLPQVPSTIDYNVFARYNRILITTKDHPLAKKRNVQLEDIAEYPLVLPPKFSQTRKRIDRLFAEKGLRYSLSMEIVGRDVTKTYVEMGLGISVINEYYVTDGEKKKLFVKNMSKELGRAETGIVTRKGRYLSEPVREFMKIVAAHH